MPDPIRDPDPDETREWRDALASVLANHGPARAHFLLETLVGDARQAGAAMPHQATTPYVNTIPANRQQPSPGDHECEAGIRSLVRWNALAMVVRANRKPTPVATGSQISRDKMGRTRGAVREKAEFTTRTGIGKSIRGGNAGSGDEIFWNFAGQRRI